MGEPLDAADISATRDPFDRVIDRLRERGGVVDLKSADHAKASCPAHSDRKPSLSVTRGEGRVLIHCYAGCKFPSILQALGLRKADLFIGPRQAGPRSPVVASYVYRDRDGAITARKQRSASKQFWWEYHDAASPVGWRPGLGGAGLPGLYLLPELQDAPLVFVVEGEKAVDRLVGRGLVATCGAAGANKWRPSWLADLLEAIANDAVVIILPDNDPPGAQHGERLAEALTDVGGRTVKVVPLAGLPPGGDVVDWLDAGHTIERLREIAAAAPTWKPGAAEQRRAAHKREQSKIRMRVHRAHRRGGDGLTAGVTVDRDAHASEAVRALLESGPLRSGRAIKQALRGTFPRAAVERAIHRLVDDGVLLARPSEIRGVTEVGTLARHTLRNQDLDTCPGAPVATNDDSALIAEEISVSGCPVTLLRVTQGVRTSVPSQKTVQNYRHTHVTGSGTLDRHTHVTEVGTLATTDATTDDESLPAWVTEPAVPDDSTPIGGHDEQPPADDWEDPTA